MLVNGKRIRQMVRENIFTSMEPNTQGYGLTISRRDRELRLGPMVLDMKVYTKMVKKMDRVC